MADGDHVYVHTPSSQRGLIVCKVLMKSQRIAFFDGPPGTGKTTTAMEVAGRAERPTRIVTMPARPAPLEVLRRTIAAFTGELGNGSKAQMEDAAVEMLTDWGGVLIIDEVQNIGPQGIHTLRYLHDRSGCSFAMLLVGWQALDTIREHPDLFSRIINYVEFTPLTGRDLFTYLAARHPELSETPNKVLRFLDSHLARGNPREWRNISETISALELPLPLTVDTARQIMALKAAAA